MSSDMASTSRSPLSVAIEVSRDPSFVQPGLSLSSPKNQPGHHLSPKHQEAHASDSSVSTLTEAENSNNWTLPRILIVAAVVGAITVAGVMATMLLVSRKDHPTHKLHPHPECQLSLTMYWERKSNFTTISDVLDASPSSNSSSFKICALYNETLNIADEKMYVMLIGEGAEKTIITSNSSLVIGSSILPSATHLVIGTPFEQRANSLSYQHYIHLFVSDVQYLIILVCPNQNTNLERARVGAGARVQGIRDRSKIRFPVPLRLS
ncbi:plant invertase/pectin methylesterase inhibitor, partial [Striga asiatica]